tara:strand:+ start:2270 stop:2467 length:198 start_codon:yes stop_codon:yes gene_type:complete
MSIEKIFELWFTLPAFGCSKYIDTTHAKDKRQARKKFKEQYNLWKSETEIFSIHEVLANEKERGA